MQTEIHTARLRLRRNRPGDGGAMHAIFADFEVARMTAAWPWPPERAFSASRCTPLPAEDGMGIHRIGGTIAIGYAIARPHWRKGYATEMGRALIAHIRAAYDWHEISAEVREKLAFERPGPTTCAAAARGPSMYPAVALRLSRHAVTP